MKSPSPVWRCTSAWTCSSSAIRSAPGLPRIPYGSEEASHPSRTSHGLTTDYLLVDTASRPGMSGAPVILRSWVNHIVQANIAPRDDMIATKFIGVYSGRLRTKDFFRCSDRRGLAGGVHQRNPRWQQARRGLIATTVGAQSVKQDQRLSPIVHGLMKSGAIVWRVVRRK